MKTSTLQSRRLGTFCIASMTLFAAACGSGDLLGEDDKREEGAAGIDSSRTTEVPVTLVNEDAGFSLAAPTTSDFVIEITACSSGYTTTVTSTTGSPVNAVPLYTGDGNCLAGLSSFSWSGISYTVGTPLTSGSALFTDGATNQLYVTVGTQLSATIDGTSEAIFLISEVKSGADYAISGYSTSAPLTVSAIEAPNLEIPANGILLASINGTTGVATFTVNVQCANVLSAANTSCQTPGAEDQPFTAMKAKLVTDTYSGVLNYTQANSIMSSGAVTVSTLKQIAPITTEGFEVSLAGAGALFSNKNMLLVIEYTDATSGGKSYRYFNVDIGNPQ